MDGMNRYSIFEKVRIARSIFCNWPMVFLDRLGLIDEIVYRTRLGPVIYCRGGETDSGTVAVIFSGREYPVEVIRFDQFPDQAVIWDVGANIGIFSIWASLQLKKGFSLLCVEPHVENLKYLKRNMLGNNITDFLCYEGVVYRENGFVNLDLDCKADAIRISSDLTGAKVKSVKLEDLAKQHNVDHVDLLKMDIEGSEYVVIESSLDFIFHHVDRLIVEVHGQGKGRENLLVSQLENHFEVTVVADNVLYFKSRGLKQHTECDE